MAGHPLRDRVEVAVRGVGAERPLEPPARAAPRPPPARREGARDGQRPLARRIDVLIPGRRVDFRGRRHPAREHQAGRRPQVGAAVPVLRRPVGVRGVGRAPRVAGPLVRDAGRLRLGNHRAGGVHHHLLDLVRGQAVGNDPAAAGVERRRLHHGEHPGLKRGRARGRVLLAREDAVGPVAGDVRPCPEPLRARRRLVLGERVAREHAGEQHPVAVVHRVEIVGVQRQQHAVVVGVVDRLLRERGVVVLDDHRGDCGRAEVGRIQDRLAPPVRAPERLGVVLDRHDHALATDSDAGEVVVGLTAQQRDQARGVVVRAVLGLRVVVVAVEVPAGDVVGVAVPVVVVVMAGPAEAHPVADDATVAEDRDQVLGREVWREHAAHMDAVQIPVVSPGDARPRDAFLVADERRHAGRARRVDPRILCPVADVEAAVAVQVVGVAISAARVLRPWQLAAVEEYRVESVLYRIAVVVDPAFDVRDQHVVAPQVLLCPGAGHVHSGGVLGVGRVERPTRQAAVGVWVHQREVPRRRAVVAGQRTEQIPLLVVVAAGEGSLELAAREAGIVGERDARLHGRRPASRRP